MKVQDCYNPNHQEVIYGQKFVVTKSQMSVTYNPKLNFIIYQHRTQTTPHIIIYLNLFTLSLHFSIVSVDHFYLVRRGVYYCSYLGMLMGPSLGEGTGGEIGSEGGKFLLRGGRTLKEICVLMSHLKVTGVIIEIAT